LSAFVIHAWGWEINMGFPWDLLAAIGSWWGTPNFNTILCYYTGSTKKNIPRIKNTTEGSGPYLDLLKNYDIWMFNN